MPIQRKILTVVLLSAGCGASSSRTPAPAPAPSRVPVPEVAATATTTADEPVVTVSLVSAPPQIVPDEQQPESVMQLRNELYRASDADLAEHHATFRALCDANGYPVVGNVASKSMRHDVSGYCQDVRTQLVMR